MKIGIDALGADGGVSGLSTYVREMVRWLPRVGTGHTFEVLHHADESWALEGAGPDVRAVPVAGCWRKPVAGIAWHLAGLPPLAARRGWDAVLLAAGNRRLPLWLPCAAVGTVHDLASFHHRERYGAARGLYVRALLTRLIERLDHAIAVSQDCRRDLLAFTRLPPERITVVPEAADTAAFTPGDRAASRAFVASRFGVHGPFFLYVSRIEHPVKNHVRLIDALAGARARWGLRHALICPGADRERAAEVHAHAAASPVARDVHFPGFVDNEALVHLYRAADGLVFPSLFEGFGLPLLEAMATGLPVACARVASLPEVGGDAARYFEPTDVDDMAAALVQLVQDPGPREARLAHARSFSWETTARRTLAILEAAAIARRSERAPVEGSAPCVAE